MSCNVINPHTYLNLCIANAILVLCYIFELDDTFISVEIEIDISNNMKLALMYKHLASTSKGLYIWTFGYLRLVGIKDVARSPEGHQLYK